MPDNIAPLYQPSAPWSIWNYSQIYTGPNGTGQFVPKVGDQVNRIVGNVITQYVVSSVAAGSLLSTLVEAAPADSSTGLNTTDALLGLDGSTQSDTFRIYIDRSVSPYRLAVDARLVVAGSLVTSAKIFAGSDLSDNARVVSATYDNAGQYLSENVGLELVASQAYANNTAIKVVKVCHTSAELVDGELVTVVFYDAVGFVVSKKLLLVENTGFIRSTDASSRAVVGISLTSPFQSPTDPSTINYPVNLALTEDNLTGVVLYNDGTRVDMAVDGTRFSVAGLDSYLATAVGRTYSLVLKYQLQPGEVAYGVQNVNTDHVSEVYNLVTSAPNLNYQVRLFAYPAWASNALGYTLRWFLYDANRSRVVDVTGYVQFAPGSEVYSPTAYGRRQNISMSLDLKYANPSYGTYVYTQTVDVLLEAPGTFRQNGATPPNWYVSAIGGDLPQYGKGVYAIYYRTPAGNNQVKIKGIYTTFADWLQAYYTNSKPMRVGSVETAAPTPTHFTVRAGGIQTAYTIDNWDKTLVLAQPLTNNSTLFLEFFVRTNDLDLQLSIAGMPLYATGATGAYI